MLITRQEILSQLRLEEEDYPENSPQSEHLLLLAEAVQQKAAHYLGFALTADNMTPAVKIAILLQVDHLDKNPKSMSLIDSAKMLLDTEKVNFV